MWGGVGVLLVRRQRQTRRLPVQAGCAGLEAGSSEDVPRANCDNFIHDFVISSQNCDNFSKN
jgi:hypothetical protein